MAGTSKIEWTERVWNPVVGCEIVSPGCTNCYAMRMAHRLGQNPATPIYKDLTKVVNGNPVWTGTMRLNAKALRAPLEVRMPAVWFVNSMSDLFARGCKRDWILDVLTIAAITPHHTFLILTKRPDRAADLLTEDRLAGAMDQWLVDRELAEMDEEPAPAKPEERIALEDLYDNWNAFSGSAREAWSWPLPNVWIGASVEDQKRADERRRPMLDLAEAGWNTFVSYEPALGPVDWSGWQFLKWLIGGGESGPNARPSHIDGHREARDFCAAYGIPYFFKQWGAWTPGVNVERQSGTVRTATWFDGRWDFNREDLARTDGHVDDEPDLYCVGKKAAGRLLDGVTHDARPAFWKPEGAPA